LANFHITRHFYRELGRNFLSVLAELGAYIACDEKLLHATGDSIYIMKVPSKPDVVGFWYTEEAVRLLRGLGFVIGIGINDSNSFDGDHVFVHDIVADWVAAAGSREGYVRDPEIVIVFDSYYMYNGTRQVLLDNNQKYIAATKKNVFGELTSEVEGHVHYPGEWYGLYNFDSSELFLNVWDPNPAIGKKITMINAFRIVDGPPPERLKKSIPPYDCYKATFSLVDRINYDLGKHKFPHKSGGKGRSCDNGHQHKFAMLIIMENIYNAMQVLRPGRYDDFETLANELALDLFSRAKLW